MPIAEGTVRHPHALSHEAPVLVEQTLESLAQEADSGENRARSTAGPGRTAAVTGPGSLIVHSASAADSAPVHGMVLASILFVLVLGY